MGRSSTQSRSCGTRIDTTSVLQVFPVEILLVDPVDRIPDPGAHADLVYLDPPFNSNANYNVLFAERDGTQAAAQCFPERDLKIYASRVSCSSCGTESPSNGTRRLFRAADFAQSFLGGCPKRNAANWSAPRMLYARCVGASLPCFRNSVSKSTSACLRNCSSGDLIVVLIEVTDASTVSSA